MKLVMDEHLHCRFFDGETEVGWAWLAFPIIKQGMKLSFIGIHKHLQNQGYGQKMLQAIIDLAIEKHLHYLELLVASSNDRAVHIYQKFGFKTFKTFFETEQGLKENRYYCKKVKYER